MTFWEICAYILALIILLVIFRVFIKPISKVLRLCLNAILGGVGLFLFNTVFSGVGFCVALNGVTAAVCGFLGIPGLLMLVILKFMFAS